MSYRVAVPVPGAEVEAWSSVRLPFEPKGWLRDFRRDLAQACRGLVAAPGQVLHAVYASDDRRPVDIEDVLTYNLGTGALRDAAVHGLVLERSFRPVEEAGFGHHHRYRLTDTAQWAHCYSGRPLATLRFAAPLEVFRAGKAGIWWLHARHGTSEVVESTATAPDHVALRITVTPPPAWTGTLIGLLKPLTDGVVAALQAHDGPLDTVAARAATVHPALTPQTFAALLRRPQGAPLGCTRLVVPWGDTLQWLPDDDRIVALDLRRSPGEVPGSVTVDTWHAEPIRPLAPPHPQPPAFPT